MAIAQVRDTLAVIPPGGLDRVSLLSVLRDVLQVRYQRGGSLPAQRRCSARRPPPPAANAPRRAGCAHTWRPHGAGDARCGFR